MKTFKILVILLLSAQGAEAHVGLNKPMGGGTYNPGDILIIEWQVIQSHPQNNWDLFYSTDGGASWINLILDLPISQLSYSWTIPDIRSATVKVKVVQDNVGINYEDISGNFGVGTDVITGVADNIDQGSLSLPYPNPFVRKTSFDITLGTPGTVHLAVFDHSGKIIHKTSLFSVAGRQTLEWQPQNLPAGLYYYQLTANDKLSSGKLLFRPTSQATGGL